MKIFFYDLETTGVKHWRNGIHQISGCIDIDGEVKEYFDFKVRPNPSCEKDDDALAVGKVTREEILGYPDMKEVHEKLLQLLGKYVNKFDKKDKFFLAGYNNASFDNQFLRGFFLQNKDEYFGSWFWSDSHDVMVLASKYLKDDRTKLLDFKLATIAAYLGIKVDHSKTHDALYDISLTREIYYAVDF